MYTICSPFAICSFWATGVGITPPSLLFFPTFCRPARNALELLAHAETETDLTIREGFENLAAAYLRLAEQAERNTRLTAEFELPGKADGDPKTKL